MVRPTSPSPQEKMRPSLSTPPPRITEVPTPASLTPPTTDKNANSPTNTASTKTPLPSGGGVVSRLLGHAIGSVVSPAIEYVDVNGVIRRVDVDELVQRIDINAVLDKVDMDRLLNRIDLNEVVARLDLDAVLDRIDMAAIVQKSNLEAIVARSSSSIVSSMWDRLRTLVVSIDQHVQPVGRFACCLKGKRLPPKPGNQSERKSRHPYPVRSSELAIAIQGRYAGIVPRFLCWLIDTGIVWVCFTIMLLLIRVLIETFNSVTNNEEPWGPEGDDWKFVPLSYALVDFLYRAGFISTLGATIGMAVFGLLAVNVNGKPIGVIQAFWREFMAPISSITIVGVLIGWVRRDGRALHDLLACTGVIYSWDARMAQIRVEALPDLERGHIERNL